MNALPLLDGADPDAPMVFGPDGTWTRRGFLNRAHALAATLPEATHAINLCDRRDWFALGFAAVLLRGQTNLLPGTRAPGAVGDIARAWPGSYVLCDAPFTPPEDTDLQCHRVEIPESSGAISVAVPDIDARHIAAIAFTSGSTGLPQPQLKSFHTLHATARLCAQRFLDVGQARPPLQILATVPPQHMFGLELSVMLPFSGTATTHAARPLFPVDIAAALAELPAPRVLVTTPVHLGNCVASGVPFPPLAFVISATAPLSADAAAEAERAWTTKVFEIYGCTEAGSMCTRRTIDGPRWRPYAGLQLVHGDGCTQVSGPSLDAPVSTPDVIENHPDGTLTLLGRSADMIKVAGKRASLAELTTKLLGLPGVEDGVVFMPDVDAARPAALVVAPGCEAAEILDRLAAQVDPVFLPRPLRCVARLPRNSLGKLPRPDLLTLLEAPSA